MIGFGQYNNCKSTDKHLEQSLIGATIKKDNGYTRELLANGEFYSYFKGGGKESNASDKWWVENSTLIMSREQVGYSIPLGPKGSMKHATKEDKKTKKLTPILVVESDYSPPPKSILSCIKFYIDDKISPWEKKGEFEKTVAFQKRVNESTRKEIKEKYRKEAIEYFKKKAIGSIAATDIFLKEYNADLETFLINISDYGSFNLPVPISKAPSFKKEFNAYNFSNLDLIFEDDKFIVSHFEIDGYSYDISGNGIYNKCIGDCQNGYGTYTTEEGTYKGNWKDGKVHGKGIFEGNEYTYDGKYVNGKQHGQGKKTYTNGTIEEGLFENGEFVGE